MGKYTTKGLYNRYDKKHKERSKTDYYATAPGETLNILRTAGLELDGTHILEPCAGGGHMLADILEYLKETEQGAIVTATDLHEHKLFKDDLNIVVGEEFDFLADNYPGVDNIDWVIMNPPFSTIEPFTIRALEIADRGLLLFARLQFLEGEGRYINILKETPPTKVWVYVDRIQCWKEGIEPEGSSAQAYGWFLWDKSKMTPGYETVLANIRRQDKL